MERASDFHEVQRLRQWWIWGLVAPALVITATVFGLGIAQHFLWDEPWGGSGTRASVLVPVAAVAFLLSGGGLALLAMARLETKVEPDAMSIVFRPFLSQQIRRDNIVDASLVTYRAIREYGGWGVRKGPNGIAYTMSGERGVQLVLSDGDRLLIGSSRPEELHAALARHDS